MRKYKENEDLSAYFDMPVASNYNMPTAPREGGGIATRNIDDLQVNMPSEVAAQAGGHLANLSQNMPAVIDDYDDFDGVPEPDPQDPTNALMAAPGTDLSTELAPSEWYSVAELPGNAQQQIRQLGNMVFDEFTETPIDNIAVMSTLSNPEDQVKRTYAGVMRDGDKIKDVDLDFSAVMPGYEAKGEIWKVTDPSSSANGFEFLLVKDFAGYYVYGYPAEDSKLLSDEQSPVRGYLESLVTTGISTANNNKSRFSEWVNSERFI